MNSSAFKSRAIIVGVQGSWRLRSEGIHPPLGLLAPVRYFDRFPDKLFLVL